MFYTKKEASALKAQIQCYHGDLLKRVALIQGLALRKNITTQHAVWCEVMGHVNKVSVRVAKSKKDYNNEIFHMDISYREVDYRGFDFDYETEDIEKRIAIADVVISFLRKLK